jgi:hypothetical protein
MSNEKSFSSSIPLSIMLPFFLVVTASGIFSLPYWNWFKSTSDYNGTATATSAFGRHIFSNRQYDLFTSFGIIQWNSDAERRVITSPEDDASYRIVGHASRACTSQRTWGGQVIKKEFNKISKLGYNEHIVEFVYTEDGIV